MNYSAGYIFQRGILYTFFTFLLIYGDLGFWGWGLGLGFRGCGFQLMVFGGLCVGPFGFFLIFGLSKQKNNPGNKNFP